MKGFILLLLLMPFSILQPQSGPQIVLSEVMFYPETGNNEFVELFNSSSGSLDIKNFKIKYYTSSPDSIVDAGYGTIIPPSSFAVILEGDYDLASGIYKNIIPAGAVVLKIKDNAFGSSGMANTTDRQVLLLGANDETIDAYTYSANNSAGYSDEKILLSGDNSLSNWRNSSIKDGTPGFKNSVSLLNYDLAADSLTIQPQSILLGQSVDIKFNIKNKGALNANNFSVYFYDDVNGDLIPAENELIKTVDVQNLNSNDSTSIEINFQTIIAGTRNIIAKINFPLDENLLNNILIRSFSVSQSQNKFNDIVINEIMFQPDSGEPEWIELYNPSAALIDLTGWSINDVYTTPVIKTIPKNISIAPKAFLILTNDSSIVSYHRLIPSRLVKMSLPVLNNDEDGVILKDNYGMLIDSMMYFSDYNIPKGYSVERRSSNASSTISSNWEASQDIEQSTPGRINSVTSKQNDLSLKEISFTPRFPVSGDNVFLSAKIINHGVLSAVDYKIIFSTNDNRNGHIFLSEENGIPVNAGDSVTISSSIPYMNLQSKIIAAGKIIYSEDEDTLNNYCEEILEPGYPEHIISINEIMFAPENGEPEWIEIQNTSSTDSVNLKNWSVSDILPAETKNFISTSDEYLSPKEFLIIARDASFQSSHPECSSKVKTINFGTLGNTSDGIVIYDFRNAVIDSVLYNSSWGGSNGYSLERISEAVNSNDSTNWTSSISDKKSTPGAVNSIVNLPSYSKGDIVINEIMYEPGDDNCEFLELLNLSRSNVEIAGWKIINKRSEQINLSQKGLCLPSGSLFILAADSSIIKKYSLYQNQYITILNSDIGLSNDGGMLLLKDAKGNSIDSISYSPKWHNVNLLSTKNISLEKINPSLNGNIASNWSSSVNPTGATPGAQNSIYTVNANTQAKISISPNPFSPDNDGFEDFTVINYNLINTTAQTRIRIFDSKGRLVRTLLNNQPGGSNNSVVFNGLDDSGHPLRIGIYIVLLEAFNSNAGLLESLKSVVVVARKLN